MKYCPHTDGYPVFRNGDFELRLVEESNMWRIVCCYDGLFATIPFRYFDSGYDCSLFDREGMEFLVAAHIFHKMGNVGAFNISFCKKVAEIVVTFELDYSEEIWGLLPGEIECSPSDYFRPLES